MSNIDILKSNEHDLGIKDFLGYSFEMSNIEVLKKHGLYKHVVFRNFKNPHLWKRQKGFGVDMVLKVNDVSVYIEESYCQHDYAYRTSWFEKCRLARFSKYPLSDNWHMRILLTNKPNNFNGVSDLAKNYGIQIMSINDLLKFARSLLACSNSLLSGNSVSSNCLLDYCSYHCNSNTTKSLNNINNVYAYEEQLDKLLSQDQITTIEEAFRHVKLKLEAT